MDDNNIIHNINHSGLLIVDHSLVIPLIMKNWKSVAQVVHKIAFKVAFKSKFFSKAILEGARGLSSDVILQ